MTQIDPLATFDDFYKLPIHFREVDEHLFDGAEEQATFAVPITDGPPLRFAARLNRGSRVLRVVMHGAVVRSRDRYPRFDRVSTSLESGDSFISFADPTLTIDSGLSLGWFTGAREWDPLPTMLDVVRRAMAVSAAEAVILIGGSGGGFAALRLGVHLPGSYAFVFAPQTSTARYRGKHFPALLAAGYGLEGDKAAEEAYEQFPQRFEVLTAYAAGTENKVYYLQNINDAFHIGDQYNPFRRAIGLRRPDGESEDGRHVLVLDDLALEKHGPPNAAEFEEHFALARQRWGI